MIKRFFLLLFIWGTAGQLAAQSLNYLQLEGTLNKAIRKVYPACVRMYGLDTVTHRQNSAQFSGVVVSGEGHILTVAHAVVPSRIYNVTFPDGKECRAMALGRIVTEASTNRPDVAMMKILTPGIWPFAELGWSSSLKINEPCFGISYPESLAQLKPMVRFGIITNTVNQWGFFESGCIMETGDSGGPLFDYMGRIIGLHSRIDKPESANYEVPVDLYRKYWTALNLAKSYSELPAIADDPGNDPLTPVLLQVPHLAQPEKEAINAKTIEGTSVVIHSTVGDTLSIITGTVFAGEGLPLKRSANSKFVISKSSMVGKEPVILLPGGKKLEAEPVTRDTANDLVLLSFISTLPVGMRLSSFDTARLAGDDLGKFLFSCLPEKKVKQSVTGSYFFTLPARFSAGYFGANAVFREGKVTLNRIQRGSPAEVSGLATGDAILSVNGVSLLKPEDYGAELNKYGPGEKIVLQGERKDSAFTKTVLLAPRPVASHPAERFEGGKSLRRDRFQTVFVHDARIRSYECGSPVLDASGRFVGINIARFSHTATVAIPATVIYNFLMNTKKE